MGTLVLGGSGFIGSKVVQELAKTRSGTLSYDVVQSNFAESDAKWIKADILEPLALERVFFEYGVESVVHLVGLPDIAQCERDPQLSFYLNVMSLQNTLEPMRKADVGYVVFASSAAVYGYDSRVPLAETMDLKPNTVYGFHKMIGERLIESYAKSYGLKYTILRLFNVYGANPASGKDVISIFIKRAQSHQPITLKGPRKFRDFVHVDDVVKTICKLAEPRQASSTLNVGTGSAVTLERISESVARHFKGVEVVRESGPDDGTGSTANVSRLKSMVDLEFRDSASGIDEHIGRFAIGGK